MKELSIWIFVLIGIGIWLLYSGKKSPTAEDQMGEAFGTIIVFFLYAVAAIIRFFWLVIEAWSN